nr:major capsid protein [Microviridae sp.]
MSELLGENSFSPNSYCGKLPKVNKYKDYFTSCVPNPQKGAPVGFSLGTYAPFNLGERQIDPALVLADQRELVDPSGSTVLLKPVQQAFRSVPASGNNLYIPTAGVLNVTSTLGNAYTAKTPAVGESNNPSPLGINNLYADLSKANSISVDDLRLAFAYQKMLERDAIYGSRYNEYLYGHFGVHIPDAYIQFPQYLGGGRTPLNIVQVAQTSQGTEESPLGNVGAYSWTNGGCTGYSRKFKEHGIIMTVACLRYRHTYQQGIAKKWRRKVREDFYDPLFSTIGQQPVYTTELYAKGMSTVNPEAKDAVFGYREAWSELRSIPNTISGDMRSAATNSLDIWHFADNYSSAPTLSQSFTREDKTNVDRVLAVTSSVSNQLFADIYIKNRTTRPMPMYSIPGLIDHH